MNQVLKEFKIPIHFEDIKSSSGDRYSCTKIFDVNNANENLIYSTLESIANRLKKNYRDILDHQNFDPLYSMILHLKSLNSEQNNQIFGILRNALTQFLVNYKQEFKQPQKVKENDDKEEEGSEEREKEEEENEFQNEEDIVNRNNVTTIIRNCLKILVFLLQFYVQLNNIKEQEPSQGISTPGAKGRGSKKKTSGGELTYTIENSKEAILVLLNSIMELNISNILWRLNYAEEEFVNLISKICYQMLENPINQKSDVIKKVIFSILGQLVTSYNHKIYFTSSMINLIQSHENLAAVVAEMYSYITKEYNNTALVSDVIREIAKQKDQKDTGTFKFLAKFISELTERIPKYILPLFSLLALHLNGESYLMRNGVTESIGYLISYAIKNQKEDNKHVKDELYNILFERVYDSNGYSRASVLKTLNSLVENNQLPKIHCQTLTKLAIGRVSDKTSQVRRRALKLLVSLITHNPYSPSLKLSLFKQKRTQFNQLITQIKKDNQKSNEAKMEVDQQPVEEEQKEEQEEDDALIKNCVIKYINRDQFIDLIKDTIFDRIKEHKDYPLHKQIETLKRFKDWVENAIEFIELIMNSVGSICQLMGSVNNSDILESINFFRECVNLGIENSNIGVSKMLLLIWNKEPDIKNAIINAFNNLYLDVNRHSQSGNGSVLPKHYYFVAKDLIDLTKNANLGEITSLEELVNEFQKKSLVHPKVVQALWDLFSQKVINYTKEDSVGALMILSMISNCDPKILTDKINMILSIGFKDGVDHSKPTDDKMEIDEKENEFMLKYVMIILQKLRSQKDVPRFKNNQLIFEKITQEILSLSPNRTINEWFIFAEQAINTIYKLAEQPDSIGEKLIKTFSDRIYQQDIQKTDFETLSKFVFLIGHLTLKQLVHIEEIQAETRRLAHEKEQKQKELLDQKAKKQSSKSKKEQEKDRATLVADSIDKELGINQAHVETEFEKMQNQAEMDLTLESNLIGNYSKLILAICSNYNNFFSNETLQKSAVLALCKLMLVNQEFCDKNLQLLFTILESSENETIRSNIVISLGDLAFRFPNSIEPWTNRIYNRLSDKNVAARKNSLLVLTHLILNDMIKVKGQISEMALCIEDPDERVCNLAKLFFTTLANKGTRLYNALPDIISRLTSGRSDQGGNTPATTTLNSTNNNPTNFDNESIRNILKYLFAFIQKDKQCETLVGQLCARFSIAKTLVESQNIAFCLQLLNYNDKAIRKLLDLYKSYQDKLLDQETYGYMLNIISKTKKSLHLQKQATELKQVLDELEKKFNSIDKNSDGEQTEASINHNATNATNEPPTSSIKKPVSKPAKAKAKARARQTKSKTIVSSEEEISSEDSENENPKSKSSKSSKPLPPPITPNRPTRNAKKVLTKLPTPSSSENESSSNDVSDNENNNNTTSKPPIVSQEISSEDSEEEVKVQKPPPSSTRKKPAPKRKLPTSSEEEEESSSEEDDDSDYEDTKVKRKPAAKSKGRK
ncbi:condensin-2 complex subunit D3 [Tieghemostelium lacteum]|uniref:Condensin-2 complex subunit D3 n=1 Tax=Tieghemostelium lacteum TaxID=361077 RepID=A0A152A9S0_TIELA|nr:condensin-2 complex subunit D3 [Tieghemostelium lacteum]|eukprot:KYR02972.1 condensin-2 complex subunit D3 [Tieghemostelium lacteum]